MRRKLAGRMVAVGMAGMLAFAGCGEAKEKEGGGNSVNAEHGQDGTGTGSEPGGQDGTEAGSEPGGQGGTGTGSEPGSTGTGSEPGGQDGTEAGNEPGEPGSTETDPRTAYVFDPSVTYQTMDGIGAAYTWYSDWLFQTKNPQGGLDALFSDAKLTLLRFKNEYEYYAEDTAPNTLTMLRYYEAAKERAAQYGEDVQVLLCCWSPPKALKTDGDITGAASLRKNEDGSYCYEEYAQWWAEAVEYYREYGIAVDYVCIQNEVEFAADYDGCVFAAKESDTQASFAKAYLAVYDAFAEKFGEDAPKMLAPETMSCEYMTIQAMIQDILKERPETLYGIAHHLYVGGTADNDKNTVRPDSFLNPFMDLKQHYGELARWQTEYYVGHGIDTATLINNCLIFEEANAYFYWSGVWEKNTGNHENIEEGYLVGVSQGRSEENPNGWQCAADYYAVRHFSEFVRPGYMRIKAATQSMEVRSSAFRNPEGTKLALVLINTGDEEVSYRLAPKGYVVESVRGYRSVFGETCVSEEELYQEMGELTAESTIVLPPKSVTSLDVTGRCEAETGDGK